MGNVGRGWDRASSGDWISKKRGEKLVDVLWGKKGMVNFQRGSRLNQQNSAITLEFFYRQ